MESLIKTRNEGKNATLIELKFNSRLYHTSIIETAIKDFGELLTGKIDIDKEYIMVSLKLREEQIDENDQDMQHGINLKELALEFYNYVLGLMKNEMIV